MARLQSRGSLNPLLTKRFETTKVNGRWTSSDALFNSKRIRALTVVDNFTRRCLAIEVDCSLRGDQVIDALERLLKDQGSPKCIRVDNGPEFVSKVLDHQAYRNGVFLDFSRPGKPIDDCWVESFNGRSLIRRNSGSQCRKLSA